MSPAAKFSVYPAGPLPLFKWFWIRPGERGKGQGPWPSERIATLVARWATR